MAARRPTRNSSAVRYPGGGRPAPVAGGKAPAGPNIPMKKQQNPAFGGKTIRPGALGGKRPTVPPTAPKKRR